MAKRTPTDEHGIPIAPEATDTQEKPKAPRKRTGAWFLEITEEGAAAQQIERQLEGVTLQDSADKAAQDYAAAHPGTTAEAIFRTGRRHKLQTVTTQRVQLVLDVEIMQGQA